MSEKGFLDNYKEKVISPNFPNGRLSMAGGLTSPNVELSSYSSLLSYDNLFTDTKYHCVDKKFIHFTSWDNALKILESGYLRMSQFNKLDDKKELVYAAEIFENKNKNDNDWIKTKKNKYCLSACKSSNENISSSDMWNTYGKEGYGVCIEYSLEMGNFPVMLLGNIFYGDKELDVIKNLHKDYLTFNKRTGLSIQDPIETNIELFAFHKTEEFAKEKEKRLFFRYEKFISKIYNSLIETSIEENNEKMNYFKLYFSGRENEFPLGLPKIRIERIILGPNCTSEIEKLTTFKELNANYNYSIIPFCEIKLML